MLARWPCIRRGSRATTRCISGLRSFSITVHCRDGSQPVAALTRNIGIIAHIDAGKTTTTERMLYYSGFTRRLGDVDEGSTVTDFLPAERARGITIQSAAVTFSWPPVSHGSAEANGQTLRSVRAHSINLIDTPGHADFTFEVLRSLRILDGAVCILDGVAGVEAQTEQVWTQADQYQIPRIVFVNKLDREGAAFANTVKEIGTRLGCWPALCQIPWWSPDEGKLQGVGDVTALRALLYESGSDGKSVKTFDLKALDEFDPQFATNLKKARIALIELLSEHDDDMVEKFLEHDEDHLAISQSEIMASLRKVTLARPQRVTPVLSGASFRNVGVQPLLDSVVNLLPSPEERPDPEASLSSKTIGLNGLLAGEIDVPSTASSAGTKSKGKSSQKTAVTVKNLDACALAFKVVTDPKRGVLVYVRVYSGSLSRNSLLFNTNLQVTEKVPRLLRMYANDAVEVGSITAGQIGVIPGLKYARTGDTLISYLGANPKAGPPAPLNTLQLRPISVPPPVFFASVEPNSLAEEKHLEETLALLLREDPSLHVSQDPESGQTHLSGMGELHLEIAQDRLLNDLKAKARIGEIQIGYREAITAASSEIGATFDREVAGKASKAACVASVSPSSEADNGKKGSSESFELADGSSVLVSTPTLQGDGSAIDPDGASLPASLSMQTLRLALQSGASIALARGPSHNYPMHSTHVKITFDPTEHLFSTTTPAALSAAARMAVTRALNDSSTISEGTTLMEPVMRVTIAVDEISLGDVAHDLTSARGAQIISLGLDDSSENSEDGSTQEQDPIDPAKIWTPPDPFASSDGAVSQLGNNPTRNIVARVPLKEMVGYLKHLRSLTGGRGTFVMSVDRFEAMSKQRMRAAIASWSS